MAENENQKAGSPKADGDAKLKAARQKKGDIGAGTDQVLQAALASQGVKGSDIKVEHLEDDDSRSTEKGGNSFQAALDEFAAEKAGKEKPPEKKPDEEEKGQKKEAPPKPAEIDFSKIDGYNPDDTDIPGGTSVKDKFARQIQSRKALEKTLITERTERLAETEKRVAAETARDEALAGRSVAPGAVEESDQYKTLQATLTAEREVISRIRLEDSSAFKAKWDDKIKKKIKGTLPQIQDHIPDEGDRRIIALALDKSINVPPGEDNQANFQAALWEVTGSDKVPEWMKQSLFQEVTEIRALMNGKHEELSEWKKTAEELGGIEVGDRKEAATVAVETLKQFRAAYETANAARLAVYRLPDNVEGFKYDATVGPQLKKVAEEIDKSISGGTVTPALIGLAHDGAELEFHMTMTKQIADLLGEKVKELEEANARIEKFKGGGTGGGTGGGGKSSDEETGGRTDLKGLHKGSGIADTARALIEKSREG